MKASKKGLEVDNILFSEYKLPILPIPLQFNESQFGKMNFRIKSFQLGLGVYIHNSSIWSTPAALLLQYKKNYEHILKFLSFILWDSLPRFYINSVSVQGRIKCSPKQLWSIIAVIWVVRRFYFSVAKVTRQSQMSVCQNPQPLRIMPSS